MQDSSDAEEEPQRSAKTQLQMNSEHGRSYTQIGNYNQQFNADVINYIQRNETPPPPLSTVPFTRDLKFIERKECTELQQKLSAGRRVAINGLGGVGKSQIAIEHCHRIREHSPDTWVFWLHANTAARFDQEIISLAEEIKLQGRTAKDANIYQLLRSWLNDSRKSKKWLIVLDNADYAEFLFEAPQTTTDSRRRIDYIPTCSHGSLLVTSRWKRIAERIVDISDIVVLEPEKQHGIEVLKRRLINGYTDESVERLAEILEYIALAISQAAAYINARNARCTVDDYIKKLEKSERSKKSTLTSNINDIRRDEREEETSNAILLTWKISFEHIQSIQLSAADLLSLVSFYDHQSIPEYLLHRMPAHTQSMRNSVGNASREGHTEDDIRSQSSVEDDADEAFESDLLLLQEFSLISQTLDKSVLQTHRLVQLSTQIWLKQHGQYTQWEIRSLIRLDKQFPDAGLEQWQSRQKCRFLFPHASRMLRSTTQDRDGLVSLQSLLHKASWFASDQGEYAQAEMMTKRSLDISMSIYGLNHGNTLTDMGNLASTYVRQGRFREAEALQAKEFEISKRVLGEEHPDMLTSMNNLASTYWNQGRLREAEALQAKEFEISKRVLGEEHPATLTSMDNLAATYEDQGRWREAEPLQVKVLKIRERLLGEEHPSTLTSMNNLASMYRGQGRWSEAEALQAEVVEIEQRVLGEEHPNTLTGMSDLALTYANDQKRWHESEVLQVKVLEIRKRVLGEEHPDTLKAMHNLAATYHDQAKLQQAQDLMIECAGARSRLLGKEHPSTLKSMQILATIYHDQGKLQQAEDLVTICAEACYRVLGAAHLDTELSRLWLEHIRSAREKVNGQEAGSAAKSTHEIRSSSASRESRSRKWTFSQTICIPCRR